MPVCTRFNPGDGFLPFLRNFAKEFYGSYAHRELSCELYDAIFSPAQPFCATVEKPLCTAAPSTGAAT